MHIEILYHDKYVRASKLYINLFGYEYFDYFGPNGYLEVFDLGCLYFKSKNDATLFKLS